MNLFTRFYKKGQYPLKFSIQFSNIMKNLNSFQKTKQKKIDFLIFIILRNFIIHTSIIVAILQACVGHESLQYAPFSFVNSGKPRQCDV